MLYLTKLSQKPSLVFILTVVITLPALFSGWLGDDYIHYALLHPDIHIPQANDWSLFGLFSWVDAEPERTRVLIDRGVLPWWTNEGFRYQFWRPLAELSHWLDHRLWRDTALLMHVQSLVWYLGLGFVLARLFRRLAMPPLAAVAALAMFLWDSTHGLTLGWIANRNAIMAALFGVLCLLWFLDWRESNSMRDLSLSLFWLLCSLFSGEIGVSTCAYLGAYVLTMDKGGARWRALLSLWPYVVVSVAWWTIYKLGNFGASDSDTNYIDPLESPILFAAKVVERIPVLLFAQFGLVPADLFGFFPDGQPIYLVIALAFLLLVLLLMWPLLRRSAMARFWALGCLFSAIPISASIPADRNLLMVGIGASALLGLLFAEVTTHMIQSRWLRFGAYGLFVVHMIFSPLLMPLMSYSPQIWNQLMGLQFSQVLPVESNKESVLLFGLSMPIALSTTPMRFAHQATVPRNLWLISSDAMNFTLRRVSATSLEIESNRGMINTIEQTMRNLDREPLSVGQVVSTNAMSMLVDKLDSNNHPTKITMTLQRELVSGAVVVFWDGKAFQRRTLPDVGAQLELMLAKDEVAQ